MIKGTSVTKLGIFALFCGGLAAGGCKETVSGEHLDTEGIAMLADVTSKDAKTSRVEINFVVGGDESNTYVDLAADQLIFSADGDGTSKISQKSKGQYAFDADSGRGGDAFHIELDRADTDKKDAKKNDGVMPDDFDVTIDAGDHSRQDALTIKWDPSGDADDVKINIDGDCIFFTFEDGQEDDGEFTVPAKGLIFGDEDKEATCEATVTVTRTKHGKFDPIFDSESHFDLHQERSAKFTSTK